MSIEVLQGLERKIIFSIKKSDVDSSVNDELKKYAKTAKIQGFRPGKVPTNIVKQMYGGSAYEESLNKHINKKFVELVEEYKLDLAGYPKFDLASSEGDEFLFSATFEIMPEVKLNDLSTVEIEKPDYTLSDADVEHTLLSLRKQRASYLANHEKIAENEDKVTIDFVGTVDGVEFAGGKAQDYKFTLGQKRMLPEFEAGILGHKVGETVTVDVTFPEDYHAKELSGKKAVFKITVKDLEVIQLPELNEEFIKSIGVDEGTEDALKQEIKTNLANEIKKRLHGKTRENVLAALNKSNPLEAPHQLVHDEIHHMMDRTKENMKRQGYPEDQIKLTHDMFKQDAKLMVTTRLLVQEFIKQNEIKVNDEEVKSVVLEMASMYDDPTEYVAWYYQDQDRLNNARAIAMENKVIAQILDKATVKSVAANYEELMR
ncbi:MAG: Trigger factor [Pseudomonadota bacterium]|nr:Trigger factor [Pseudomonadota bacterium]